MALEDFIEPEVGIAVALTAAVASPSVRKVLRKGAVYGLAGILMAGDAVSSLAQGVKRGVQQAASTDAPAPVAEDTPGMQPEILSAQTPLFTEKLSSQKPSSEKPSSAAAVSEETAVLETPASPKRPRKTAEVPVNE